MTDTTSIGIVGLGGMASKHAGNIEALGHNVVAGTDVVQSARESFAYEYDAATYESHQDMLANEALDGVIITTPNKFHEPPAVDALSAGISVLCEKPLAHSLESAERIEQAASGSAGFCMLGFHNRFNMAPQTFHSYRGEGRFGDITHIEANYIRRRGIPGIGTWFTDKELSGGGAVIDIGVHAIDFALFLAGYPTVTEVTATTRTHFGTNPEYHNPDHFFGQFEPGPDDEFNVEDSASAFLRTADGTTISLEVAWATNRTSHNEFIVRGTDGGATMTLGGDSLTINETNDAGTDHYVDATMEGEYAPSSYEAEAAAFLEGIQAGEAPAMNTVEEGLAVQRVIDGIYRSSKEGQAVSI